MRRWTCDLPGKNAVDRQRRTGHVPVVLLALGLGLCEIYKGFLTPLLPLLIPRFSLTLAAAGALSTLLMMSAALGQVMWGRVGDRHGRRALLILGPVVTGLLAGLVGIVPNEVCLAFLLVLTGLAASIYPPQSAAVIGQADHKDQGNSGLGLLFMIGILGAGSTSLVVIPLVGVLGLERLYISAGIGILFSMVLAKRVSNTVLNPGSQVQPVLDRSHLRERWVPLGALLVIAILRAATSMGFSTFIPVLMSQKGVSLLGAGTTFSLYMYAGALGSLIGSWLMGSWGARTILLLSLVLPTPLFLAFGCTRGPFSLLCLGLGSAALYSSLAVNVSIGQKLLPGRPGMISALMMGFSWGVGSLASAGVGALADRLGLAMSMTLAVCMPLISVPLVRYIPSARVLRSRRS